MSNEKKAPVFEMTEEAQEQADADPRAAAAYAEFRAVMTRATALMQAGEYSSVEDAVEALTGERPVKIASREGGEDVYAFKMPMPSGDQRQRRYDN